MLPLARPALVTLAIFTLLSSWNDLLWPLVAISDDTQFTLQVGLASFQGTRRTEWSQLMAGNVVATMPLILAFLVAQRRFVATMTFSGLKGMRPRVARRRRRLGRGAAGRPGAQRAGHRRPDDGGRHGLRVGLGGQEPGVEAVAGAGRVDHVDGSPGALAEPPGHHARAPRAPSLSTTAVPRATSPAAASSRSSTPVTARSSAALGRNTSVTARISAIESHRPLGSQLVSSDVRHPELSGPNEHVFQAGRQRRLQEQRGDVHARGS